MHVSLRTQGYDDTMLAAIETPYGKNLLQRVHDQAVDEWKQRTNPTSALHRIHPTNRDASGGSVFRIIFES